ncbi:MAG: arylsulfatase A-like enzyme [Verrucomicrobiales bacterium]|jgi:arylsulfatase A-like enzyme
MIRRFTILSLFLAAIGLASADPPRPNILYFYVDDMGWGSVGPNGQFARRDQNLPHLRTPTLDRLAAEGVNFTRSYGCTVCSPARSSQQSGFHQGHTFADRNNPDNARKAMRADEVLMGDALSKAGYVTGYWGKWGYGGSKSQPDPQIENVQTLPTQHGYQHVLAELHHVRAHTFFQPTLWKAPAAAGSVGGLELAPNSMKRFAGNPAYPQTPALQNHAAYPKIAYCDDSNCFAALDFVREQAQNYNEKNQPFFGLLAVQVPHSPFDEIAALPEWNAGLRDDPHFSKLPTQAKQWAAMVSRIDGHFGNILEALEDPNGDGDRSDSVADNTLVIFQSDNGGPQHAAREALGANAGLRGSKGQIFEGGIRIPTIMRWPESALKPGASSDRVIDVTDLLPTFCELAGTDSPVGIDGVSLAPTLVGTGTQRTREFLIHEAGNGQSIIRGSHKLIRPKKGPLELYDLDADEAESKDIAAAKPSLVKELETLLLGERVAEPQGFANTYHRWTGSDGAEAADAENWSDYEYSNEGITYLSDDGAPRASWTALMENATSKPAHARAGSDLEFLGLEIRGNSEGSQTLILEPGVSLTGRNEIRISNGSVKVDGGTVSSLRWIDLKTGGVLMGSGTIDAQVFNSGMVYGTGLSIKSGYQGTEYSSVHVRLIKPGEVPITVEKEAEIAGELSVGFHPDFKAPEGEFVIFHAKKILGRFKNADDIVNVPGAGRFQIVYDETEISLKSL